MTLPDNVRDVREFREQSGVFADRDEAGRQLAVLLAREEPESPRLLAIPAGGMPVAVAARAVLNWPLAAAVVSKIVLPWDSEAGYGAVAWDGSLLLNRELLPQLGLSERDVERGIAATRAKVAGRVVRFGEPGSTSCLARETTILVDDGLASGVTMRAAVAALKAAGASRVVVAVPTAYLAAVTRLAAEVDRLLCVNLRSAYPFAVAAAYRHWRDVSEHEALALLRRQN